MKVKDMIKPKPVDTVISETGGAAEAAQAASSVRPSAHEPLATASGVSSLQPVPQTPQTQAVPTWESSLQIEPVPVPVPSAESSNFPTALIVTEGYVHVPVPLEIWKELREAHIYRLQKKNETYGNDTNTFLLYCVFRAFYESFMNISPKNISENEFKKYLENAAKRQ